MSEQKKRRRSRRGAAAVALACAALAPASALAQRLKGVDISDWQGSLSQTTWNNVKTAGRDFTFLRSDRGGTSGFYDETKANNSLHKNVLGQRYDDLYWGQNVARAVTPGVFVGPYHFRRP